MTVTQERLDYKISHTKFGLNAIKIAEVIVSTKIVIYQCSESYFLKVA